MTRFGHAQVLGFSEDVQKAIEKESAILKENGTDPDVLLAPVVMHRPTRRDAGIRETPPLLP